MSESESHSSSGMESYSSSASTTRSQPFNNHWENHSKIRLRSDWSAPRNQTETQPEIRLKRSQKTDWNATRKQTGRTQKTDWSAPRNQTETQPENRLKRSQKSDWNAARNQTETQPAIRLNEPRNRTGTQPEIRRNWSRNQTEMHPEIRLKRNQKSDWNQTETQPEFRQHWQAYKTNIKQHAPCRRSSNSRSCTLGKPSNVSVTHALILTVTISVSAPCLITSWNVQSICSWFTTTNRTTQLVSRNQSVANNQSQSACRSLPSLVLALHASTSRIQRCFCRRFCRHMPCRRRCLDMRTNRLAIQGSSCRLTCTSLSMMISTYATKLSTSRGKPHGAAVKWRYTFAFVPHALCNCKQADIGGSMFVVL